MKKDHKGVLMKGDNLLDKQDRAYRLRSKEFSYNSPNKENDLANANLLSPSSPLSPLSPVNSLVGFNSPARTTPLEAFECMRSNKSKETLQERPEQAKSSILFSGLSKDGRYRVESKSFEGQELEKAVEYEKKVSLNSIISSGREKDRGRVPEMEAAKISTKENGVVRAYAINTHAGTTRSYNEDRVSITLNIKKNGSRSQFFAVYDGHGGSNCCDYLKDTLHEHLIAHKDFPSDPKRALHDSIMACEIKFCQQARRQGKQGLERSGSCALVVLLVQDTCYVANVGDSRAVLSAEGGKLAFNLSRDHRPIDTKEQQRILTRGGKIYRTEMTKILAKKQQKPEVIIGPLRIFPGKLSVSRTIGDIEAKQQQFGGTKGVISAQPQIKKFRLTGRQDFILLCCDGIFERMESMQAIEIAWRAMRRQGTSHELAGRGVDAILRQAMRRKTADNLTAIMICLSELKEKTMYGHIQSP